MSHVTYSTVQVVFAILFLQIKLNHKLKKKMSNYGDNLGTERNWLRTDDAITIVSLVKDLQSAIQQY